MPGLVRYGFSRIARLRLDCFDGAILDESAARVRHDTHNLAGLLGQSSHWQDDQACYKKNDGGESASVGMHLLLLKTTTP